MALYGITKKPYIILSLILLLAVFTTSSSAGFLPFKTDQKRQSLQSEQKVGSLNDQAVELFEQGRFEEAQKLWEQAIELLENTSEHVSQYSKTQDVPEPAGTELISLEDEGELDVNDVDKLYDSAVSMFKQQKYVASKKMFDRIEATVPDYKASRNYLTILEHKISQAQQTLGGKKFSENSVARREERMEWERILEESRIELESKLAEQADPLYQEAVGYYKSRDFKLAKDYFTEVEKILPHFKDAEKYLDRISKDIRDEEERLLEEKRSKEMLARKEEKEEWQRVLRESERELQKRLIEQVEPVYQEAVEHYKKREFELAKGRFEEAQLIVPSYKSTLNYLDRIGEDMKQDVLLRQKQRAIELEQQQQQEELARKTERKKLQELRDGAEQKRLQQFQMEVAARRKEREEWIKILEGSEKERERKLKEQAQFIYGEAVEYYKKREFGQAKEDFLEVHKLLPDYESTAKYLARIDSDIEQEQKQRFEEKQIAFRRQMKQKKLLEQQQWEKDQQLHAEQEQAQLREFNEKALARKKQREEWEKIIQENERVRQKKLENEAEFIYQEALRSYKAKRWEQARNDFFEVERTLSGYKETKKYLDNIDRDIEREAQERRQMAREATADKKREVAFAKQQEEQFQMELSKAEEQKQLERRKIQAESVYKFAVSLHKREDYAQAKEKFLEVDQILPGYKLTEKYLKRLDGDIAKARERDQKEQQLAFELQIRQQRLAQKNEEERLDRLKKAEDERRLAKLREEAQIRQKEREEWEKTIKEIGEEHEKRLRQQAESVYQEALRYYNAGWFQQAKETFAEVDTMLPGYKSTGDYLAKIGSDVVNDEHIRQESEKKILATDWREEDLKRQKEEAQQRRLLKEKSQERIAKLKEEVSARQKEKERLEGSLSQIEKEHNQKMQEKAETLYRSAQRHYKAGDFEKAKIAFIDVEKILPGYKSTAKYLAGLDKDIMKKEQSMTKVQQKQAVDSDFSVLEQNGNKIAEQAAEERQDRLSKEAEAKYREAVALYKAKEFSDAKLKFIELESLSPGYKSTLDYLSRIDKDISDYQALAAAEQVPPKAKESQSHPSQRSDIIQQVLLEVEDNLQEQAAQAVPEHQDQRPPKRKEEEASLERQMEQQREELKVQRLAVQKEYEKQFQKLYAKALDLYRDGSYEEAQGLFLQIEQTKPGYKKAAFYLKKTEAKIGKGIQEWNKNVVMQPSDVKTRKSIVEETLNNLEKKL